MERERPRAKHDSWHTLGMPAARIRPPVERALSAEGYRRISDGLIPRQMEDKRPIYRDGDWLAFQRSWTGYCTYRARPEQQGERFHLAEAWANCEGSQRFGRATAEGDAAFLLSRIAALLLGKPGASGDCKAVLAQPQSEEPS